MKHTQIEGESKLTSKFDIAVAEENQSQKLVVALVEQCRPRGTQVMVRLIAPHSPNSPTMPAGEVDIFKAALQAEVAAQDGLAGDNLALPPRPAAPQNDSAPSKKLHPLFKSSTDLMPETIVALPPAATPGAPSDHPLLSGGPPKQPPSHPLLSSSVGPPRPPSDHPLLSGLPPSSARRGRGHHSRTASASPALGGGSGGGGLPPIGTVVTGASAKPPLRTSPTNSSGNSRRPRGHRRVQSLPAAGAAAAAHKKDAILKLDENNIAELTRKLAERRKKYGDGHVRVGLVHNLIGNCHFRRGEHDLAAKSYDEALLCFKSSCSSLPEYSSSDEDSTSSGSSGGPSELRHQLDVAVGLGNIGAVMWSTGRMSEAVDSLEKSVAIRRRVRTLRSKTSGTSSSADSGQKEGMELSNALYSLGLARSLRGDYDEALDALNQARDELLRSQSQLLSSSSSSSSSVEDLSQIRDDSALSSALQAMDAQSARERALRSAAKVELARVEDAIGKVHLLTGDADSALRCHLRALEDKAEALGSNSSSHPSVLSSRSNAAAARRALGRYDEAASELGEVLAAQKLALYRQRDPDAKKRLTMDIADTTRALGEVQREQQREGKRVRMRSRGGSLGVFGSDFMAAIVEERDGGGGGEAGVLRRMESGSQDDWGLARIRS